MEILDLKNLQCPMPILKTKQALQKMNEGDEIQVITTDPHSEIDFKAFLGKTSNELVKFWVENDQYFFFDQEKVNAVIKYFSFNEVGGVS